MIAGGRSGQEPGSRVGSILRAIPLPAAMAGSLLLLALGALIFMRLPLAAGGTRGAVALLMLGLGVAVVLGTLAAWIAGTIRQADGASGGTQSPRVAMFAFIVSEIAFFAAFFCVYFYYAIDPEISGMTAWPPAAARPPAAWGGPLANTAILLASGVAVAGAHNALLLGNSRIVPRWLLGAIGLGLAFLALQGREYWLSPLSYQDGIYPSLFYIATGFHGLHVIVGLTMLGVCVARLRSGEFNPHRHFGFEAAVWYWHFVDAVWLILFAVFYVWVG